MPFALKTPDRRVNASDGVCADTQAKLTSSAPVKSGGRRLADALSQNNTLAGESRSSLFGSSALHRACRGKRDAQFYKRQ